MFRRFLAIGDLFRTIAISYRLGHSTVQSIIIQVCEAIENLMPLTIPLTKPTENHWKKNCRRILEYLKFSKLNRRSR